MSTERGTRPKRATRPSSVTLSCVFVAVLSFTTLIGVIDVLMDWGTIELQQSIEPMLRAARATGAHVTMDQVLGIARWILIAMVPFTVSAMVFAVYALRGDRASRAVTSALTAGAGLISLSLGVFGLLQAGLLFLAAAGLWTTDARRWYAGLDPAVEAAAQTATPAAPGPDFATLASPHVAMAPPGPAIRAVMRPASVMTAGLLTVLGSLGAGLFAAVYIAFYTFAREAYVRTIQTGPFGHLITLKDLELGMQVLYWESIAALPLMVAGLLGGVGLLMRRRIGRPVTLFWAWSTTLLGMVMFPLGLVGMLGGGAVIFLLFRDDARRWTSQQ